jgi:hypothetical protein
MSTKTKIAVVAALAALISAPAFAAPAKHRGYSAFEGAYGSTVRPERAVPPAGYNRQTTAGFDRELVGRLPNVSQFGD